MVSTMAGDVEHGDRGVFNAGRKTHDGEWSIPAREKPVSAPTQAGGRTGFPARPRWSPGSRSIPPTAEWLVQPQPEHQFAGGELSGNDVLDRDCVDLIVAIAHVKRESVADFVDQATASLPGERRGGVVNVEPFITKGLAQPVATGSDSTTALNAKSIREHEVPPHIGHDRPVVGRNELDFRGERDRTRVGVPTHTLHLDPQPAALSLK